MKSKEIIEYVLKFIELLRPRFYNRITWFIVVAGIGLISAPLWERILDALIKSQFDLRISGPNDAAWGFALCVLALAYHSLNAGIYDALRARAQHERDSLEIEHDRAIFSKASAELTEQQFDSLLQVLAADHSYRSSAIKRLDKFCCVLAATENAFLRRPLVERADEFLVNAEHFREFVSYKFFVFPSNQLGEDFRFCMQPAINIDREGDGSAEQMRKYDELSDELSELIKQLRKLYVELRMTVKRELVI